MINWIRRLVYTKTSYRPAPYSIWYSPYLDLKVRFQAAVAGIEFPVLIGMPPTYRVAPTAPTEGARTPYEDSLMHWAKFCPICSEELTIFWETKECPNGCGHFSAATDNHGLPVITFESDKEH